MPGKNGKKKTSKKSSKTQVDGNITQKNEASSVALISTSSSTNTKAKFSVDDLMDRVNEYVEKFEFDLAIKFCEKAEKLEPDNVNVLETFGNLHAEIGDIENARYYYERAVKLEPNGRHVKYLCLAQLSDGLTALEFYEKSIDLIKNNINDDSSQMVDDKDADGHPTQGAVTIRDLSTVYCSMAEIFMTDLCMEENAEIECKKCCQLAIDTDKDNMDGYLTMSNCLLSTGDVETATANCKRAFEVWQRISEITQDSIRDVIPYPSRLSLVKLLIEVEEYPSVSPIIEQLIEENEDDVLIWYYIGLSKSLQRKLPTADKKEPSFVETSSSSSSNKDRAVLESPRHFLERAKLVYSKTLCQEKDILEHIEELLGECEEEQDLTNTSLKPIDEIEGMELDA